MRHSSRTGRKLRISLAAVIVLSVSLAITSYALVRISVSVRDHVFHTGIVAINLNAGNPIVNPEDEMFKRFEPGMRVVREFDVINESTDEVYYSVYLEDVKGELAQVLEISVWDDDILLCSGTAEELEGSNAVGGIGELKVGETRTLKAYFYYPADAGNETQGEKLEFTMSAKAVQKRNNPDKQFD